jgi:hypothetical protein
MMMSTFANSIKTFIFFFLVSSDLQRWKIGKENHIYKIDEITKTNNYAPAKD